MRQKSDDCSDVQRFLEKIGLETDAAPNRAAEEFTPEQRASSAARRSDVYRRALARAYMSDLRPRRAA